MSLDTSIAELMTRLVDWSKFPKYQLERRVDVFLTPFLAPYLGHRLAGDPANATLVAPEFPLLASLRLTPEERRTRKATAHTVNADYLVRLDRPARGSSWVLVELKTDGHSYCDRQFRGYWNAMALPMSAHREHLRLVEDRTESRHDAKYAEVERALDRHHRPGAQVIEVAYLGPAPARAPLPEEVRNASPDDPRRDRVHLLSLAALAREPDGWVPDEHRALWTHVRRLLVSITSAAPEPDAG